MTPPVTRWYKWFRANGVPAASAMFAAYGSAGRLPQYLPVDAQEVLQMARGLDSSKMSSLCRHVKEHYEKHRAAGLVR